MYIDYAISLSDLEKAGYEVEVSTSYDKDGAEVYSIHALKLNRVPCKLAELDKALHYLGMDNKVAYNVTEGVEHLDRSGKRVKNRRIVGTERHDKKWLQSGFASEEAKLASSGMRDMVSAVRQLGR